MELELGDLKGQLDRDVLEVREAEDAKRTTDRALSEMAKAEVCTSPLWPTPVRTPVCSASAMHLASSLLSSALEHNYPAQSYAPCWHQDWHVFISSLKAGVDAILWACIQEPPRLCRSNWRRLSRRWRS
jgi:hypothetical protein